MYVYVYYMYLQVYMYYVYVIQIKNGLLNRDLGLLNRDHGLLNRNLGLLIRDHELLNRDHGLLNRDLGLIKNVGGIRTFVYKLELCICLSVDKNCVYSFVYKLELHNVFSALFRIFTRQIKTSEFLILIRYSYNGCDYCSLTCLKY